jgi:hypothetical protein
MMTEGQRIRRMLRIWLSAVLIQLISWIYPKNRTADTAEVILKLIEHMRDDAARTRWE